MGGGHKDGFPAGPHVGTRPGGLFRSFDNPFPSGQHEETIRELPRAEGRGADRQAIGALRAPRHPAGEGRGPVRALPLLRGRDLVQSDPAKNCFHCFSCKAGGNMLDLVALREECSVREAALKVAEWFGVETERPPKGGQAGKRLAAKRDASPRQPSDTAAPPEAEHAATGEDGAEAGADTPSPEADPPILAPASVPQAADPSLQPNRPLTFELKLDPEHPWLAEVGLLPETVAEFGLGFCSKGMMAGRICFPIRNAGGELVGYAGRWPGNDLPEGQPLWRYPKRLDLSQVVYPADRLQETQSGRELFAVDPLRTVLARQMGVHAYFAPGCVSPERWLEALKRARDSF